MRCAQRHSLSLRGVGAAATRQSSPAAVSRRGALLAGGIALSLPTRTLAAAAAPTGAADILRDPKWPESFPFGASELGRYDETEDSAFYSAPRFVTHMDDGAIAALTAHYAKVFPKPGPGVALLGAPLADGGLWPPAERHPAGGDWWLQLLAAPPLAALS